MTARDATLALRKVAALRALCLRLPHLPTPAEQERLRQFETLVASPEAATDVDVDALVVGWRRWWLTGRIDLLLAMASRLPAALAERDLRLAGYLQAARMRNSAEERPPPPPTATQRA
ncbi:MAG: hypothetical protein A3F92_12440 [Candidatus Rokubacteria bacterium RIFCSPLOWO2_12_FULL_71_22]|nr:MAG: hypothetical protein A3F92_12440 [Candidatus Rokubacteria bacterium RIFCSPLOWO2_12_FULL_71_22]